MTFPRFEWVDKKEYEIYNFFINYDLKPPERLLPPTATEKSKSFTLFYVRLNTLVMKHNIYDIENKPCLQRARTIRDQIRAKLTNEDFIY